MKGREELEILISESGEVRVMVKGIKGPSCIKTAENFAGNIGRIKEMTKTSEFYQKEKNGVRLKQSGKRR